MKPNYLLITALVVTSALSITSCGPSEADLQKAIREGEKGMKPPPEKEEKTELFTSADGKFSVNFFGASLVQNSTNVPTDLGDIEMVSFIYEKSVTEAYMVTYSDYPSAYVNSAEGGEELLDAAKDGALRNLGIKTTESERKIKMDGYPGLFFTGNNGQYFITYKIYLVGSRLYQVAILRDGSYALQNSIDTFMNSFSLLKSDDK